MSLKSNLRPLLTAQHFTEADADLISTGLAYDATRDENTRRHDAQFYADQPFCDAAHGPQSPIQGASRCAVHPIELTAKQLLARLKAGDESPTVNLSYGLPSRWPREWAVHDEDYGPEEGQEVVVVCFAADREPVGFASLVVCVSRDVEEQQVDVRIEARMVYVTPSRRGQGFGLDLSVASGRIVASVLAATYRAAEPNWSIEPAVVASFESEGGEKFVNFLIEKLEVATDDLRDEARRSDVSINRTYVDVGY